MSPRRTPCRAHGGQGSTCRAEQGAFRRDNLSRQHLAAPAACRGSARTERDAEPLFRVEGFLRPFQCQPRGRNGPMPLHAVSGVRRLPQAVRGLSGSLPFSRLSRTPNGGPVHPVRAVSRCPRGPEGSGPVRSRLSRREGVLFGKKTEGIVPEDDAYVPGRRKPESRRSGSAARSSTAGGVRCGTKGPRDCVFLSGPASATRAAVPGCGLDADAEKDHFPGAVFFRKDRTSMAPVTTLASRPRDRFDARDPPSQ